MKVPKITLQTFSGLWLPLAVIIVYIFIGMLIKNLLPSGEEVYNNFANIFSKYGYWIVLVGSMLEAALIIDLFLPGASIIIAGAFFSSQGVIEYPIFLIVTLMGTMIGFLIDYLIGYFGWAGILKKVGLGEQLKKAQIRINRLGFKAFFLGYIHPDVGSFYAVSSGVLNLPLKKFLSYSSINIIFWLLFWTLPIFIFGSVVKDFLYRYMLVIAVIIISVGLMPNIVSKIVGKKRI